MQGVERSLAESGSVGRCAGIAPRAARSACTLRLAWMEVEQSAGGVLEYVSGSADATTNRAGTATDERRACTSERSRPSSSLVRAAPGHGRVRGGETAEG